MVTDATDPEWLAWVKHDLAAFADLTHAGPRVRWTSRAGHPRANWERNERKYDATFEVDESGQVWATFRDARLSYEAFLASPELGNLDALARRTTAVFAREPFVRATAISADAGRPSSDALHLLSALAEDTGQDSLTKIVFVTGDAGSGKTSLLKQLLLDRAASYLKGEARQQFLYIDAQGKALATFEQALAGQLDDLGSTLLYPMIAPLVRADLIVPMIDGFDELLGSTYDDTFSSLTLFLEQLRGRGTVIACARSTFFEQEFLARINAEGESTNGKWHLVRVDMEDWSDAHLAELLDLLCGREKLSPGVCRKRKSRFWEIRDEAELTSLLRKPFFAGKLATLVFGGDVNLRAESAFGDLVSAYLAREREKKLLDKNGKPLLDAGQLQALLAEIAAEMWRGEQRFLDVPAVRLITDMVLADQAVARQVKEYLQKRGPMLGVLASASAGQRVEFQHELFFSYFLSDTFVARYSSRSSLADGLVLARGALPAGLADRVAGQLVATATAGDLVGRITRDVDPHGFRSEVMRENAGTLVAALLRAAALRGMSADGLSLRNLVVTGEPLPIELTGATFANVEVRRCDLRRLRVRDSIASDCRFASVVVDPRFTRIEIDGIDWATDLSEVRLEPDGAPLPPSDALAALRDCGLPSAMAAAAPTLAAAPDVVALVARLSQSYVKSSLIWPSDDSFEWLRRAESWELVRRALVRSGLVTVDSREVRSQEAKRTQRESLRRTFNPAELVKGADPAALVSPAIRRFWDALGEEFPP